MNTLQKNFLRLMLVSVLTPSAGFSSWYLDRDNSMSDVNDKAGRAMVVIESGVGYTQGIQVCPGVFLATAHGALESPKNARAARRPIGQPKDYSIVVEYPMSSDKYMTGGSSNKNYTSPRLRNIKNWKKDKTDYVFIKVDKAFHPKDFVVPVETPDSEDLIELSERGLLDVHLYRGKTMFQTNKSGVPDFVVKTARTKYEELKPWFDSPQRVNQKCELSHVFAGGLIANGCPTEGGVSGSSYISKIKGRQYLVGLHKGGWEEAKRTRNDGVTNGFIPSKLFCKDYQKVCGRPCVRLSDVLRW